MKQEVRSNKGSWDAFNIPRDDSYLHYSDVKVLGRRADRCHTVQQWISLYDHSGRQRREGGVRQRDEWVEELQRCEMHLGSRGTQLIYISRVHTVRDKEREKGRVRRMEKIDYK